MATTKKVAIKTIAKSEDALQIEAMLCDLYARALKDVGAPPAAVSALEITNMRWLSVYALRYSNFTDALIAAERYKNDAQKRVLATRRAAARYKKFEELHNHFVTRGLKSDAAKKKALAERGLGQQKLM